ncbi:MAG: hypothetical protein C4293_06190 [Nitrospiraceae bacterium]
MTPPTIFTTCKPFKGEFKTIQANALTSWAKLRPWCEVIIFGNEDGVAESCKELGIRHVEEVPRSEYGTPLMNGLFKAAEREASSDILVFVNADIMLTNDLMPAVQRVATAFGNFLLIARRWNVDMKEGWDFSTSAWDSRLRAYARRNGRLEPVYGGIDLFVYVRGMWQEIPPFAIGRGRWDSALIYMAIRSGVPVIDATEVVTCVHQNHGYAHHPQDASGVFKGPEAVRNNELLGGDEYILTSLNATYLLTASGMRRQIDFYPPHLLRRLATFPALYKPLKPFAPIVRMLAPSWRKIQRSKERRLSSP